MSSKSTASKSSREEKLERIRQQNAADARRQRYIVIGAVVVIVALVAVTVGVIALAVRDQAELDASDPAGLTLTTPDDPNSGGFTLGTEEGGTQIAIYEDFQCPACAQYEAINAEYFAGLEADPAVDLVYRPIAILNRVSGEGIYSTRSAAASACVAETGDDELFVDYRGLLFLNQPAEGGNTGLPTEQLAALAVEAGADSEVEQCILDERYNGWADRATVAAQGEGVAGTPTVRIDGEVVSGAQGGPPTAEEIQAALDAAAG